MSQKNMEEGFLSFLHQWKTGSVSGVSNSSMETVPVATTEIGRGQMVNESCKAVAPTSSKLSQSTHTQPSTVPLGHSETLSRHHGDSLTSAQTTLSKDKLGFGSNLRRHTSTKGKKKIKEILQKADAAGTTSDLYMAYKGPEEKKESSMPLESVHAKPGLSDEDRDSCSNTEKNYSRDEVRDSSSNTEKKYSRDFLLKFEDMFTALPQGFDVSPDFADTLFFVNMGAYPTPGSGRSDRRPSNQGFRSGQGGNSGVLRNSRMQGMQHVGPMGGMGRDAPDLERWQGSSYFQQKERFSSPHTPPMQVMHQAERKYQVGTVTEEEEAKQRQLKSILNKLTPQNFEKLIEQVKSVNIDSAVTVIGVISHIFDKASMEPTFCEMYADFCFHLSGALPDFNWNGEEITFKRLLLNKCQEEFERGEKKEEEASRVAEEEREEKRLNVRRRRLCTITLIGELYKKRMLTKKIMHACIQKLLGYDLDPHEQNIEALCKLMSTIGVVIDHHKAKVHMDAYFERMEMLSCKQELSSRVRFMLMNAIDLRKNKWQERMKVEGPIPDTVGNKDSCVFLKETSTINESMDVNGFHVLPSQVESVMRLFDRHPDIAVGFRAKNQLLRNSCMNTLLSLIETLCQPLQYLSNEDFVGADIALTYVKDSGFRVDWLEKKLDQVKEKKKEELSGFAILKETEENLKKLKLKCAELEALAEEQKVDLSATRTTLSFDDVV